MDDKKPLQRIKTGAWARTWSLSRLTVGATARAAGHAVGSLFASDEEKQSRSKELLKSQLTALTEELGQLKGSAMKAGQMLSMLGEHFLARASAEYDLPAKALSADAPLRPRAPLSRATSTSTVGKPRESRICRALIRSMLLTCRTGSCC